MIDLKRREIESGRPDISALEAVNFCLAMLHNDKTKSFYDTIVKNLSFEELFGALLLARDDLIKKQESGNA